jgi:DNA topoisomerase-1
MNLQELLATQRFERPPARFSEAALVKKLEELGIGRPSTYAPTISTVQKREYVVKESREGTPRNYRVLALKGGEIHAVDATENTGVEKGKLFPTDIGMVVNDFLVEHFSTVIDQDFTANVEKEFDAIADGKMDWREMLKRFYKPFRDTIEHTFEHADPAKGERHLGEDPQSGRPVFARIGRYGPMVQIGTSEDEEKPKFASIRKNQSIATITYDEAMDLFKLPKSLGEYKGELVEVHDGRYGPYLKHGSTSISLEPGQDPLSVEIDDAITLIKEKEIADLPIHHYKGHGVTKGKGRFGPFIKWNGLFINVNRKYDWDNLSNAEIEELVDAKIQKEIDKVVHHWEEEGIRVEKARWGRHTVLHGKVKIELPKSVDAKALTLEEVQSILNKNAPKKKATKKSAKKKSAKSKAKKKS